MYIYIYIHTYIYIYIYIYTYWGSVPLPPWHASTLLSARIRPCVQRNLAHKKQRPPRTIQKTYA